MNKIIPFTLDQTRINKREIAQLKPVDNTVILFKSRTDEIAVINESREKELMEKRLEQFLEGVGKYYSEGIYSATIKERRIND